jgi:methylated-DNA-protein-cysteine methyltransferase-like protein
LILIGQLIRNTSLCNNANVSINESKITVTVSSLQRIHTVLALIPSGTVVSYGQLADLAGLPGRARLAGTALKNLPAKSKLPWHRVLRSNGQLAFPVNSDAFLRQQKLLAQEGVAVKNGRVDLNQHQWRPALSDLLALEF